MDMRINLFENKQNTAVLFLFSLCVINLLLMHYDIVFTCQTEAPFDYTSITDNLFSSTFDVCTILFFCSFICRKKIICILLMTYSLTLIWAFSNILYARFFHSYLSLSAISQSNALIDPIVIRSAIVGLRWQDLFLGVSPVLFYLIKKRITRPPVFKTILIPFFLLILFLIIDVSAHISYCINNPAYRYITYFEYRFDSHHFADHNALCEPILSSFHRGSIRTLGKEFLDNYKAPLKLSEIQLTKIRQISEETKNSMNYLGHPAIKKNVVLVIIESYMSFTSMLEVDGKEVTPFLNSLRRDSLVYYNGRMNPNITIGESSDGQFLYMTGLLPLRSIITISKAKNRVLPGLPKVMKQKGMKSRMIIPTKPTMWEQVSMCKQYGFDLLLSSEDYQNGIFSELSDEQVFDFASEVENKSKDCFFTVILTMSMHQPYLEPVDQSYLINNHSIPEDLKNYLNACHYTDKQIEKYMEGHKKRGTYDNTMFIITSDHHVHSTGFGDGVNNLLPLYIINGDINSNEAWYGDCNQIDVYTTILNLLDIKTKWYGLGHSLLTKNYSNSVNSLKFDISEWILFSDYFKNIKYAI